VVPIPVMHTSSLVPGVRSLGLFVTVLVAAFMTMSLTLSATALAIEPTPAAPSLGGSPQFEQGADFPFVAGSAAPFRASVFLQNPNTEVALIATNYNSPAGVTINVLGGNNFSIPASSTKVVEFDVIVAPSVARGRYPVIVSFGRTNIPEPEPGRIAQAPAFSTNFTVNVSSDVGEVFVRAESADDQAPISGDFALIYLDAKGPVPIYGITGSSFARKLVPGKYRVDFAIPGIAQTSKEFFAVKGRKVSVNLSVSGIRFKVVSAEPITEAKKVMVADLSVEIGSSLRDVPGPVTLSVLVSRDGNNIETIEIARFASLPKGSTVQNYSYRPVDGFGEGTWSFKYTLKGRFFTLDSESVPQFQVLGQGWGLVQRLAAIAVGLLVMFLLILAGWWLILARRRRKAEEEEGEPIDPLLGEDPLVVP